MRILRLVVPFGLLYAQEKPVALYSGTGIWKDPITTKSLEALRSF
jgi:hypothetical protein